MGQADRGPSGRARRRTTTVMAAAFALIAGTLSLADAAPVAAGAQTAKLVYVAGTNGPPNGDKPIVALVEDLGFDVIVLDDDTPDLAALVESITPAVIVVSSSVTPIKIGDMFTDSPRPVVTWEPYIFDDLGLTENRAGQRGEESSGTAIKVIDSTHPITAPLSGHIAISSASRPLSYGVPAGDVSTVATIAGSTTRAAIMAAATGDELADGVAAGRRVGLFMTWSSQSALTDNGRAIVGKAIGWAGNFVPPAPNLAPAVDAGADITITLPDNVVSLDATVFDDGLQLASPDVAWTGSAGATFDDAAAIDTDVTFDQSGTYDLTITADDGELQTSDDVRVIVQDPDAPPGTEVIFVVGNAESPPSNDRVIADRLLTAGLTVTLIDDDALPAELTGVDGVVISTSVQPLKVGTTFTDVDIPILTWEGYLLDDLGLSDGPNGETPNARKTINIVNPAHPLAAGYTGDTSVITSSRRMAYGTAGAGAEVVAFDGSPNANRAVLFAYLTNAPLPGGGTAPARRVVAFPDFGGTGLLTAFGTDIMDAAIAFFLVPDNGPPTIDDQSRAVDENSPTGTVVGTIDFDDPDIADGDVVTVAVTGGSGATAFAVSPSGEITVADEAQLDHETNDILTLDVTVTDLAGETDSAIITIGIDDINDAPVALPDGEGAPANHRGGNIDSLVGNDSDQDGDPLEVVAMSIGPLDTPVVVASPSGREATFTVSNSVPQVVITWGTDFDDLAVGESDSIVFTYTVSDPGGLTDTANVTTTFGGVNDDPVAVDDDLDVAEGDLLEADILGNDTDVDTTDVLAITGADGNPVSATFAVTSTGGRDGTATVEADGALNLAFDQDRNFEDLAVGETDTVTFDYDITDGNGGTDTGTVTITVNGANDPPVAVDDTYDVDEDGALSEDLRSNDQDPDGDTLVVQSIAHAGGAGTVDGTPFDVTSSGGRTAVVSATGTTFTLSPNGNFDDLAAGQSDTVALTYVVADPGGLTDGATVTVTVNGKTNPPVAADFGVTAIGNTQLRSGTGETGPVSPPAKIVTNNLVTASADAVSATAATDQATTQGGSVDIDTDGSFVYTPPTGFTGTDTFTYTVVGDGTTTDDGTVTVTVENMVWYVSTTGRFASDAGRSHDPIHSERVDVAGPGDTVYFFPSATNHHTDGYQPLTGQTWIGAGVPLVVDGVTLTAAGTAPTFNQLSAISSADVTMRGMTVAGLASFGGAHRLNIDDVEITRYFILVNSIDVSIDVDSFNDLGGGGFNITNVTGSIDVDSFNATTLGGGTPAYLNLVNAGTVTINGTTNTIDAPNGPVVNIVDTTIAGSGTNGAMAFQSLTGQSFTLDRVTGGFEVTGIAADTTCGGSAAGTCSGGTVGTVSLTNAGDVSLNKMKVLDASDDAVTVSGAGNVNIVNSEIIGAGDAADEDAIVLSEIGGTFTLTDSFVTGFHDTGLRASNTSGTATITVDRSHFSDNHEVPGSGGDGENAIDVRALGNAQLSVNITGNEFDDIEVSSVNIVVESAPARILTNVINNTIRNQGGADDFPTASAINLVVDNLGTHWFDVQANTIENNPGDGVSIAGNGDLQGRIGGQLGRNTIRNLALGDGINIDVSGDEGGTDDFTAKIVVQNNLIENVGDDGIQVLHRDNNGTLHMFIEDNDIFGTASEGIRFFADHDFGGTSSPTTNLVVARNDLSGIPGFEEIIRVDSSDTAVTCASLDSNTGFDGSPADEISLLVDPTAELRILQASIGALATANSGAAVTAEPGVIFNGGCVAPSLPNIP